MGTAIITTTIAAMDSIYTRTELLLGPDNTHKLKQAHVLIVGLGGVGGYAAEMLCRSGVGNLTIVDGDTVQASNRNRQLIALTSNEGKLKTKAFAERFADINPAANIEIISEYLRDDRMKEVLDLHPYDYVVDAIDTLSPKLFLLYHSYHESLPIVSSMGSGGKLDPTSVQAVDISQTEVCPLAAVIRKKLHRLGVYSGITAVYSPEKIMDNATVEDCGTNKRSTVGTISYMPPVFGCVCASVVIRGILGMPTVPKFKDKRFYQTKLHKQQDAAIAT